MEIYTSENQIKAELACRDLSDKASIFLNETDLLTVYEYQDEEGETKYAYTGCVGDREDLTFEELQENFGELADSIWSEELDE